MWSHLLYAAVLSSSICVQYICNNNGTVYSGKGTERKAIEANKIQHECSLRMRTSPVTWGMWTQQSQWFSMKRWSRRCEPPKTYQSRSSEASCHLDLTLSHILTCGTLLWKETEKTNKQTGLIKTLVWGEEAIKRLIMHGICIKALKVIPTQTCSTSHKHVRLLDSFTCM